MSAARWPSVLPVAFFTLLAVATSASAECAWVLWLGAPSPMATGDLVLWMPQDGYESLAQCRVSQQERQRAFGPKPSDAKAWVVVACFPDTVDPRGPKAK